MFVVHIAGKKPKVDNLPENSRVIFFGQMTTDDYCLITAPETLSLELGEGKSIDLSDIGLAGHIGRRSEFTSIPITRGCLISNRCFAHGEKFFFSYHGQEPPSRSYYLHGCEFKEIFVHFDIASKKAELV